MSLKVSKAGSKLESSVQPDIIQYLTYMGGWHVKTVEVNRSGCPDILWCHEGRFIAIEVKRPDGDARDLQEIQMRKIREAGGLAFVASSVADVIYNLHNL